MSLTQEYEQYILNEKHKFITKKFIEQTLKQYYEQTATTN